MLHPSTQSLSVSFLFGLLATVAGQGSVTDYEPLTNIQCPNTSTTPLLRIFTAENQTIHPQEVEFIQSRSSSVLPEAWTSWLSNGSGIGYNLSDIQGKYPKVGVAISGGGYRAAQYGAGVFSALDARNDSAKFAGTGGLLQVTSYMTGLSGGSWLLGSLFLNNWPTIPELVLGNNKDLSGWLLDLPLFTPDGVNIFNDDNQAYYGSIVWSVMAKAAKGIDTSLTDPWARMISYHFLNQTTRSNFFTNDSAHGAGQLWSEIPLSSAYEQGKTPFPIIVADSRPGGSNSTDMLPLNATAYEISPLEFGSYDPNLSAMVNMTYAGTHLSNGEPSNSTSCVTNFDQAGFMMGTSASLFNTILDTGRNTLKGFSAQDSSGLLYVLNRQLQEVRTRADDVANWPNPFSGLKPSTFQDSNQTWLELIDGGSNGENVPLGPLLVKSRGLDVIIGVEATANTDSQWPNGTAPIFTATRISTLLNSSHQAFPPIPLSAADFISTGVNRRPTFFGCDPQQTPPEYPLVIYLPNAPPLNGDNPVTNTNSFKLSYTTKHTQLFLDQAYANTIGGFTPNSNSPDPNFPHCLQCAVLDRARFKVNPVIPRSAICTQCFQQYCYDPKNPPSQAVLPNRKYDFVDPDPQGLAKVESVFSRNKGPIIGGVAGFIALVAALILFRFWRRKRQAKYKRISNLRDDDTPWRSYPERTDFSYELPAHRGTHVSS